MLIPRFGLQWQALCNRAREIANSKSQHQSAQD